MGNISLLSHLQDEPSKIKVFSVVNPYSQRLALMNPSRADFLNKAPIGARSLQSHLSLEQVEMVREHVRRPIQ